jgi:hypothetical protein
VKSVRFNKGIGFFHNIVMAEANTEAPAAAPVAAPAPAEKKSGPVRNEKKKIIE